MMDFLRAALMALALLSGASGYAVPNWPPTYNMSLSTVVMPCNNSGFTAIDANETKFGIIDFDWSNAKAMWAQQKPMDCEERLLTQAQMTKAANPAAHVWVYRNTIKALPWFTSVRKILNDPDYAPWFMKFSGKGNYHVPQCDKNYNPPLCTEFYHDQDQTPEYPRGDGNCAAPACDVGNVPIGEYLWDWRAVNVSINGQTLLDWYLNSYAITNTSILSGVADGFYLDDGWSMEGPSEMDPNAVADMGLSTEDLTEIVDAYHYAYHILQQAIYANKGFDWQSFMSAPPGLRSVNPAACASALREWCSATGPAQAALWYDFTNWTSTELPFLEQDLANFLLIRGDYAWIGYGWSGCSHGYPRPPELDTDYGSPTGLCQETGAGTGVFTRDYTKATVKMDCSTWTGSITLKK